MGSELRKKPGYSDGRLKVTGVIPNPHFSDLAAAPVHSLPRVIAHVADRYGDKPFIVGEDGSVLGFTGFRDRVNRLARALIVQGVEHGDRIAIWAPNSADWIIVASAIETIGAILIPINTRFKGAEAAYVLSKTRAKMLFTVRTFLGIDYAAMLRDSCAEAGAGSQLPALSTIVCMDSVDLVALHDSMADGAALAARIAGVTPQSIADILFTSGTTGRPKGAMHNHGQALWAPAIWNEANDLRAGDRMAIVNPFFHSFGYRCGWVSALGAGITVYPMASFHAESLLSLIEREKVSVLMGPPTIFLSLMEHPRFGAFDISSLRVGHTGASNVPADLIRAGREIFGFDIFLTSFGQTECSALATVNYSDADFETIARTVGKPVPGVELKIVDAGGAQVAPGESGELLIRGPNVMQGYFEEPEQTAAAIDADGWLHSGDVGCIRADGNLCILDRLKDVVIVGGFNAYPAEIEMVLRTHPAVADISIIAWPDARLGEVCAACAVLKPGKTLTLSELTGWSREQMANYKVPRHLFLLDEFPRTPLGKVQKFLLRQQVSMMVETP